MTTINTQTNQIKTSFHLLFVRLLSIYVGILKEKAMLHSLIDNWKSKAAATAIAVGLAFGAVAPAHAGEPQTVTLTPGERGLDAVQGRRDMRHFSEDTETRGIGVFINLQANAPMTGDQIGEWVKAQFAGVNVPVEYRFNQSRGTGTDLTFYVRGVHYVHNIDDVPTKLPEVYANHQGAWLPETVALNGEGPQVTRN